MTWWEARDTCASLTDSRVLQDVNEDPAAQVGSGTGAWRLCTETETERGVCACQHCHSGSTYFDDELVWTAEAATAAEAAERNAEDGIVFLPSTDANDTLSDYSSTSETEAATASSSASTVSSASPWSRRIARATLSYHGPTGHAAQLHA